MTRVDDLTGRIALITGGNRGIGRAIGRVFARAGADIAFTYLSRETEAVETRRAVADMGRRSVVLQADVSKAADVARVVEAVARDLGPVDILVNNAGLIRPQALDAIAESDWDEIVDINLKSAFLMTQAVVAGMRTRRWGRIINLSSVAAQLGGVVGPHYAAAKAGLFGLTHSYAALLAGEGITANAIAPALIATEMVTSNPRARADLLPVGRFGQVDEVAEVALLLARNGYVTGQTYNVNGGWYMS
jgi:3-oxoacyl-[acyl-carrier protein] reductase